MIKYIKAEWSGKGFITHQEKENGLSFNCFDGINILEGDENDIKDWRKKNKGVEITEKNFKAEKIIFKDKEKEKHLELKKIYG